MKSVAVRAQRGFTLLEMSIVLAIIAVVVGMSASTGVSMLATARLTATQQKMKAIEDALMAFRAASDRLPCPADLTITPGSANYGVEGATPGTCTGGTPAANHSAAGATNTGATGVEGAVPTVTLSLANDFMYDGWGRRFRYAVDKSMTANGAFSGLALACTPAGAITVNDATGAARSTGTIYALISHGANGHGAYTKDGVIVNAGSTSTDEQTNCHCTAAGVYSGSYAPTYVQKDPAYDAGHIGSPLYYFDDLVTYKERWQMPVTWDTASCSSKYIYVMDAGNLRVEKFDMQGNFISQFPCASGACASSSAAGQFHSGLANFYCGMTVDLNGNVWVADTDNHRIEKFDANGTFLLTFGTSGSGDGQLSFPTDVAVDSSGNVWVTDTYNYRVQKFSGTGTFISKFGTNGTGDGQFTYPLNLTIDTNGNIWVAEDVDPFTMVPRIQKFNSSGVFQGKIGSRGSGNGKFGVLASVASDGQGNVFTTDDGNSGNLIQKFNSSVAYVSGFGIYNYAYGGTGAFFDINGIAYDSSGNLYVIDDRDSNIVKFDSNGNYLSKFGSSGSGNGQFGRAKYIAIGR